MIEIHFHSIVLNLKPPPDNVSLASQEFRWNQNFTAAAKKTHQSAIKYSLFLVPACVIIAPSTPALEHVGNCERRRKSKRRKYLKCITETIARADGFYCISKHAPHCGEDGSQWWCCKETQGYCIHKLWETQYLYIADQQNDWYFIERRSRCTSEITEKVLLLQLEAIERYSDGI